MLGDQLRRGGVHRLEVGEVELSLHHLHPVPKLLRQPRQPVDVAIEQDERRGVLGDEPAELRP